MEETNNVEVKGEALRGFDEETYNKYLLDASGPKKSKIIGAVEYEDDDQFNQLIQEDAAVEG